MYILCIYIVDILCIQYICRSIEMGEKERGKERVREGG